VPALHGVQVEPSADSTKPAAQEHASEAPLPTAVKPDGPVASLLQ